MLVAGGYTFTSFSCGPSCFGGIDSPNVTAEIYDPDTGTWSSTESMATFRGDHTATLLSDERVLVAGGFFSAAAEIYDPDTGT